jgi:hypothetical protein
MKSAKRPPDRSDELDLEAMEPQELEKILTDTLTVKYPGIEQADIERYLRALDSGDPEQVEQTEADLAEKSALWQRAALELENKEDGPHSAETDV